MTGIIKIRAAVLVGLGLLLAIAAFWGAGMKEEPMEAVTNSPTEKTIPLIDRQQPANIATATFALG